MTVRGALRNSISSKELALIEEEKRQKSLRDREKIRLKQEKLARIVPNQGLQPKKSILKSSGSVSNYNPYYQSKSNLQISSTTPKQAQSKKSEAGALPEGFFDDPKINKETKSINDVKTSSKVVEENIPNEEAGTLPEGFFDDPKLDAKARNVEYVSMLKKFLHLITISCGFLPNVLGIFPLSCHFAFMSGSSDQ